MNYYLDAEFIEGFHKPLFGKRRHFIDLISIGIVCEDGRTYYAISNEFNPSDADEWVCTNVLIQIIEEYIKSVNGDRRNMVLNVLGNKTVYAQMKIIQKWIGKSNKQIAEEVKEFVLFKVPVVGLGLSVYDEAPKFYAYYADYDWVLFCSLFGRMIDLPERFPMYCRDLKQMIDEVSDKIRWEDGTFPMSHGSKDISGMSAYPFPNTNEHNALADAKWNLELHKFLKSI